MKTRSQKLISLVLVLMMLVTMIPAGFFGASAVSAELATGLANYDNTAEFVINNVDDWNTIAATSHQFEGKTVKLGADINAQGATLPQLFACGNVRCTFDGQGYAIKNVGTAETPNTTSLFSNKSNLNVQNLTVENCHVAGAGNKGLLVDWQNCWAKYTFKNIKIIDSSVVAEGYAGVVIGYMSGNGGAYGADFENIQISGCSVEGNAGVGSLIGYTYLNSTDYGASAKNIEVVNTTITDNTAASCAAGLFGFFRFHKDAILTVENAYVNATFVTPNSSGWTGVDTALFQTGNSSVANANTITVKNCVTNCTYSGIVQSTTLFYATQAIFVTENLYSVQNNGKSGMLANGTNTINGVAGVASGYNGIPATVVTADVATAMVQKDADGFITAVKQEGLYFDLANYDSIDTFTINSAADWNLIATSGKGFLGKTIKLGCDIDAKGGELKTLIPQTRSGNAFWANFDGQGYTIKNATVANALFAHTLMKGANGGVTGAAQIKNVKLDNITVTGTDAAFIAVQYSPYQEEGAITIDGIKITNSSVTATGVAGGMYASVTHHNASGTDGEIIKNVYMSETVTITGGTAAGGLIGQTYWNSGWLTVSNIETYATVAITTAGANYVGGLVGNGAHLYPSGTGVTVTNCIIGGTLKDTNDADQGGVGGVFGYVAAGGTKSYTMKNLIVVPTFESADRWKTLLGVFGGAPVLTISGILSTTTYTSNPWPYIGTSGSLTINGIVKSGGELSLIDRCAIQIVKIDPANIENLVKRDEAGALVKVYDGVAPKAIQYSKVENGTYAIRFIAMSQLTTVTNLKMTVIATYKDAEGNTVRRKFEKACDLYDVLSVYGDKGITERYSAADYGAEKLAGLTIYNIPADTEITFEVTTSYDYYTGALTGVTGTTTLTETSSNPQIFTASVVDGELVIKD